MSIFKTGAKYYEIFSDSEARLKREGPFLINVLNQSPGLRAADLACGTGLHADFLARNGARVDAFDISEEMVEHARSRYNHPAINYSYGDMRELSGGPWDIAVCLGNSISVLITPEDIRKTFKSVSSSLCSNGLFLIQLLNYQALVNQKPRHRVERKEIDNIDVVAVKNLVPIEDKTFLSLSFFALTGKEHENIAETTVLKNWTKEELISIAEDADFCVDAIYGGYDLSEFNPTESGDLLCVFRKK